MIKVQQVEQSEKFNSQLPHLHSTTTTAAMSNGTTAANSSSSSSSQQQHQVDENNNSKITSTIINIKSEPSITSEAATEKNVAAAAGIQSPQSNEAKSNIEEKVCTIYK